jgi:hypothetical protein
MKAGADPRMWNEWILSSSLVNTGTANATVERIDNAANKPAMMRIATTLAPPTVTARSSIGLPSLSHAARRRVLRRAFLRAPAFPP